MGLPVITVTIGTSDPEARAALFVAAVWTRAEWLFHKGKSPLHWDSIGTAARLEWFDRALEHMGETL